MEYRTPGSPFYQPNTLIGYAPKQNLTYLIKYLYWVTYWVDRDAPGTVCWIANKELHISGKENGYQT